MCGRGSMKPSQHSGLPDLDGTNVAKIPPHNRATSEKKLARILRLFRSMFYRSSGILFLTGRYWTGI